MHPGNSPAELIDQVKDLIGRGVLAINLPAGDPLGGRSPASPDLAPFWQLATERNIAVLVHVGGEARFVRSPEWSRVPAFKPGKIESHELGSELFSFATVSFAISNFLPR
jgi:hypothetical protein